MKVTTDSPVKTILCTIDFSQSTRHSLEWAVSLAAQMRARLSILFTYRLNQPRTGEVGMMKKVIEDEARQKFQAIEKDYLSKTGIAYEFKIEIGFVSDRIEDHAKNNALNFVVMDKHVRANSNETFEELIEHVHVPILLIP